MPLEVAESRDPKGLYAKARKGEIRDFTGISAPYEQPDNAEIVIYSGEVSVEEALMQIVHYLEQQGLLPEPKDPAVEFPAVACEGMRE